MRNEQTIIMEMTKEAHALVLFYLKHLKEVDPYKEFECEGKKLNSAYWVTAHLCSIADMLFFKATGTENPQAPSWLSQFGLGSDPNAVTEAPTFEEAYAYLNSIYKRGYELILSLSDETLDQPNLLAIRFGDDISIRKILYHQIRHEASHAGNLAWICKLNGIKTI